MTTNNQIVVGILLILALGAGYMLGAYAATPDATVVNSDIKISPGVSTTASTTNPVATSTGTQVDTSRITDGQMKLMKALGVDPAKVTITSAMVLCAETSLGSGRVAEIQNGATPSVIEGGKLLACYNK